MMNQEQEIRSDLSSLHKARYYRVRDSSVLMYECIIPPDDTSFYVGDIIVVEDLVKEFRFFARIINMLHSDADYHNENPNAGDTPGIRIEALAIGYTDTHGSFFRPRTVPTPLSRVVHPKKQDYDFLQGMMGDLEIGYLKTGSGTSTDVAIRLPSPILNQHMGVFATTGMGKSNLMKVFCASSIKKRACGLLLIDPHGEYVSGLHMTDDEIKKGLLDCDGAAEGLVVYSTRTGSLQKEEIVHPLRLDFNDFRIEDLELLYTLSPSQWEVIESLRYFSGKEILQFFLSRNVDELPTKQRLTTFIGDLEIVADKIKPFSIEVLRLIQRRIISLVKANQSFLREEGSVVREIVEHVKEKRVVLIDIPELTEKSELFILSVLTRAIFAEYKESAAIGGNREKKRENNTVLITIEEAQRVLSPGGSGQDLFREVAMEGRKFGVGLCVITQQPKNIDPRILAQMNTFIVMGLADGQDREMIAGSAKHDLRKLNVEIQTLDRGDAIISSVGIPFPMSTRIHLFEEYISR